MFRPLSQAQATSPLEVHFADCTAPMSTTTCTPGDVAPVSSTATNQSEGVCLAPHPGTVRPYNPAVTSSTAPCFATAKETIVIDLDGLEITLQEAQVGGTYVGTPAGMLVNGLLLGFLSEEGADATIIPSSIPVVGGQRR